MGKYKKFYIGKNLPQSNDEKPLKGEPNSFIDEYYIKTGNFSSRRKIGKNGLAVKDMDVADYKHKKDHVHDFDGSFRGLKRDPDKREVKEFNKLKRRRKFMK